MSAAYSPADIFVLSTRTQRKPDYYCHILTWEQSHNLLYINLQSKFMYFFLSIHAAPPNREPNCRA